MNDVRQKNLKRRMKNLRSKDVLEVELEMPLNTVRKLFGSVGRFHRFVFGNEDARIVRADRLSRGVCPRCTKQRSDARWKLCLNCRVYYRKLYASKKLGPVEEVIDGAQQ